MSEIDPLAELVQLIRAGGWAVSPTLPPNVEDVLPRVQVLGLPGAATHETWGGRTLGRVVPFDVYVLADLPEVAGDIARDIADHVEGTHGRLSVSVKSLPHQVADLNPRVKRYLFTASASYRR